MVTGGEHRHYAWGTERFTGKSGYHSHVFLIDGKLVASSHDGDHRHEILDDLTVGPQLAPHSHEVEIAGKYYATTNDGAHAHPKAVLDRHSDREVAYSGEHRHIIEVEGVRYESLTSADLLAVEVRKRLNLDVCEVMLWKERFLTFEKAARWIDDSGRGFSAKDNEERESSFVFKQIDRSLFDQATLKTIEISDGVQVLVGVMKKPAEAVAAILPDGSPVEDEEEEDEEDDEVDAEEEEEAFEDVQERLTAGYDVFSDEEVEKLADLQDEHVVKVLATIRAVEIAVEKAGPTLNAEIDANGPNAELAGRIGTNLDLLHRELSRIKFPETAPTVDVDGQIQEILKSVGDEALRLSLSMVADLSATLFETFTDTEFVEAVGLFKSAHLSTALGAQVFVAKAVAPTSTMTREELLLAQTERARTFGIEIVAGSALTFPSGFPTDLALYGDPVNLKFPFDTAARARNARTRFKQFADQIYSKESSKAVVHTRIVERELELGVGVTVDLKDPLDQLLPESILSDDRIVVSAEVEKRTVRLVTMAAAGGDERTAFGIVLEPNVTDLHDQTYDEEAVKGAAHTFMESFRNLGLMHEVIMNDQIKILESYLAPVDMSIDTPAGPVDIRKNTWLMKVRVLDDELWAQVKSGELSGFSFGGLANVQTLRKRA